MNRARDGGDAMRLLDLFSGAGGAAVGYSRAGFDVVGVDIKPQKNYPFEFHCADAFAFLEKHGHEFDVIHASPPCQAFSAARTFNNNVHPDLLTPMRTALDALARPWIIENVPNAPMRVDILLCGSQFGLKTQRGGLIRHRWFELSHAPFSLLPPCQHPDVAVSVFGHGGPVGRYHTPAEWGEAMGIDWMTRDELAQAIPPAYTEWIGRQLLKEPR